MKIKTQDYNDVTVVEMQGELDSETVDQFEKTITEVITHQTKGAVLDLRTTGYIDSEGLEKLLWARDYCFENNCQLRLAGLDENCRKVLELTRLENEFDQYAELAEAVKSFA